MKHSSKNFRYCWRAGFTLVELMLSIAMVLLLMIGINAIFRTTADTVGTGQAAIHTAAELRNASPTFSSDFNGMLDAGSQPVLMIFNQNITGFSNKTDMNSDPDYLKTPNYENALHVFDSSGAVLPIARIDGYSANNGHFPVVADNRNHRIDILSFFTSGHFRRQTGMEKDNALQSSYTSDSAYIWYGQTTQPAGTSNNATNDWIYRPDKFRQPGMTGGQNSSANSNPNGFFANQWILGRMAILLGTPDANLAIVANNNASTASSVEQGYLDPRLPGSTKTRYQMYPFAYNRPAIYDRTTNVPAPTPKLIQDSTCDLAGISASDYRARVMLATVSAATGKRVPEWYYPLISSNWDSDTAVHSSTLSNTFRFAGKPWATRQLVGGGAMGTLERRTDLAYNGSTFIHGCSQFIVEFAGDYYQQQPDVAGTLLKAGSDKALAQKADGILDFDVVPDANGAFQKRIRWYGMERRYANNSIPAGSRHYLDVMHVSSWIGIDSVPSASPFPFEKIKQNVDLFPQSQNDTTLNSYPCAWSPYDLNFPMSGDPAAVTSGAPSTLATNFKNAGFMPWMIRITIRVDDPNGRLPDGQTIQYVFNLPHKQFIPGP